MNDRVLSAQMVEFEVATSYSNNAQIDRLPSIDTGRARITPFRIHFSSSLWLLHRLELSALSLVIALLSSSFPTSLSLRPSPPVPFFRLPIDSPGAYGIFISWYQLAAARTPEKLTSCSR